MEKKYSLRFVITLIILVSALSCLVTSFFVKKPYNALMSDYEFFKDYNALLDVIDNNYIGQYDEDMLKTISMKVAVEALDDRWSYYMTPEEYYEYQNSSNNQYTGIGVGVVPDEQTGGMYVQSIYKGSAAETAGIVIGDVIIAIDGIDVKGEMADDMRDRLSRQIGDCVDLTVIRADESVVTITVVYSYVFVDPVSFEMLDGNIGYVQIANFDQGASDSFISAVEELIGQGAFAFIFDVRNNFGGRLNEMTPMLDYLLPEGEIFVAVDKSGVETIISSEPGMIDLPCVVLDNRYSFSAAEYFAATLGEYGYAKIVGEQTTGKSRMQSTFTLPGGGAVHISTDQYLTVNRVSLYDAGGLTPDYLIELTDEEMSKLISENLEKEADPQLAKAIELLAGEAG